MSAAICAGLLAAPGAGAAAQVEVTADPGDTFSPRAVQIEPGDSVVFRNSGGEHNVKFDDGSFTSPATPSVLLWTTPAKIFPARGSFRFYCVAHGDRGGVGMSGEVNVGTPLPDVERPSVAKGTLTASSARKRLKLSFRTNESGTATAKFTRLVRGRYRAVRTVRRKVKGGKNTITLSRTASGRRLVAGRYRATVTVRDKAGNISRALRVSKRLR